MINNKLLILLTTNQYNIFYFTELNLLLVELIIYNHLLDHFFTNLKNNLRHHINIIKF